MNGHKKLSTRYALPSNSTQIAEPTADHNEMETEPEPVSDEITEYPSVNNADEATGLRMR